MNAQLLTHVTQPDKVRAVEGKGPTSPCHSERSEESLDLAVSMGSSAFIPSIDAPVEILRCAQNDKRWLGAFPSRPCVR